MQLLLDTHIWIWSVSAPENLSPKVRKALESPENVLWLSPISVWEATLLFQRGRLLSDSNPDDAVREMLRVVPQRIAAFTYEVAIASCTLDRAHRDPADRFLAARPKIHELTLVTAETRLLASREYATLENAVRRKPTKGARPK
ncbi:MAG: type II toxin-antitoxin system VapC family toxin [Gemmatimonadales bacterium]